MEQNDVPKEFFDVVDAFIHLANDLNQKWPTSRISSAMMYAAARYNAFNFYTLDPIPGQNLEKAVEYFCDQYKVMLLENVKALKKPQPGPAPSLGRSTQADGSGVAEGPPSLS